jgi:butyryl-CoA dehydrogenase
MFVMMNLARFGVGMQGIGIADRAYQAATAYARERVQGKVFGATKDEAAGGIIGHPDVRRMLMTMRALTEAARALAYVSAAALDAAHQHPGATTRAQKLAHAELMIPIVKGWSTEVAQQAAYLGVQVHGGMGFIEETGAAQYARDARITTIYEGTTGIQANDLVVRKVVRDKGKTLAAAIDEMRETEQALAATGHGQLVGIATRLRSGLDALDEAGRFVVSEFDSNPRDVLAGAVPFLELAGIVFGGAQLARAALIATRKLMQGDGDVAFMRAKIVTARHFADHCLVHAPALRDTLVAASGVLALAEEQF